MSKIFYEFISFTAKFSLLLLLTGLSVSAQCEGKEPKGLPAKPYKQFFLEGGTRFKVKFDAPLNGGNYRTGDLIQFKVIEDVFGVVNDVVVNSLDEKGVKVEVDANGKPIAKDAVDRIGERIVVIKKDTIGFGKVDFAKRRFPLFLKGKARLTVTLDYLILESGDCIPITVSKYQDERIDPTLQSSYPQYVVDCKNIKNTLCIRGRRPNTAITTAAVAVGSAGILTALKDAAVKAVAAVTLLDQLTKQQGLTDLINGQNSEISDKLIFEVTTTQTREGSIKSAPPK